MSNAKDVLIIGAGIAGLVTAYECLAKGLHVTLVERDAAEHAGGLARTAFGGMALVGTPLQQRMKINDTPGIALRDWLSFGGFSECGSPRRKWAEYYVENSARDVYQYLIDKGLSFLPAVNWVERGEHGDGNSLPRYHVLWGTGKALVDTFLTLISAYIGRTLTIHWNTRCENLIIEEGRVSGCRVVDEQTGEVTEHFAGAVVVATGGINGNMAKVREHWHRSWGPAPAELLNGSHPNADGKLHDEVAAKGGAVTNLENMWNYAAGIPHPKPHFDGHGLSLIPCKSALWLDAEGQRIGPEPLVTGFDTHELCRRISLLGQSHTWQLLNWRIAIKELAVSGAEHNPSIRDKKYLSFLKGLVTGNHRLVRQLAEESDHFIVAEDLPELVSKMNALNSDERISLDTLEETVKLFDAMVSRGQSLWNDSQLRKIGHARSWRPDRLRTCKPKPILDPRSGPLVAIKLRLITRKSLGGIQTDLQSRVLDEAGCAMQGLYAVGEASGFGGGGASGLKSLEGTFLSGCILTAQAAAKSIAAKS